MKQESFNLQAMTQRNIGYINTELQKVMQNTKLLIAGCGIGSTFAEAAVRLGFENLTLVDGDTVSLTNLNRQNFRYQDVGLPKVEALKDRLLSINPNVKINACNVFLTESNISQFVTEADFIFDTIDFLDLKAIIDLHDECKKQNKPTVTALAIGWGAGCIYFPKNSNYSFRKIFDLPELGSIEHLTYAEAFAPLIEKLKSHLDPQVIEVVLKALTVMEDGTPCPASQVAPGAYSVGALGASLLVRILNNEFVCESPKMLLIDMKNCLTQTVIDFSK